MRTLSNNLFIITFILMAVICHPVFAKNLGVMGETYPIIETDFLEFIQSRAVEFQDSGKWQDTLKSAKEEVENYRNRPTPVQGISRTIDTKVWDYDPSITLDHNVSTPEGKLIALAGTRINPLVYVPLTKTLIFLDSDDKQQVVWATNLDKALSGKDKIILINGSVPDQENTFGKSVYFDQNGRITGKFGIAHVPATVVQDGLHLKISEVKP